MRRLISLLCAGALVAVGLLVLTPSVAQAAGRTLSVPAQYKTINAAVAAAGNGDTILVYPGTYRENITISGKYVALKAASSNPAYTVIAGPAGRTPVMFTNVPLRAGVPRASITGFRITGGNAPNAQGGGITATNRGDALIQRNLIEGNRTVRGGGIVVYDRSNAVVQFNTIRNNTATHLGGGMFVALGSSPQIYGNTITGNKVAGGTFPGGGPAGGGLYVGNDGNNRNAPHTRPNISRNSIGNNSASFAGGGMMLATGTDAIVAGNHIFGNRSAYGGGVHIENYGASPSLSINTIDSNSATRTSAYSGSGSGGGISVFGYSRPKIGHNSINNNAASYAGGGIVIAEGSSASVNGNRLAGNTVTTQGIGGFGGGIGIAQAGGRITNNVVRGNRGPIGGGVAMLGTGKVELVNNVLLSNTATQGSAAVGGGLYVGKKPAGTATIFNNIITANNNYQVFEYATSSVAPIATYGNNQITNSGDGMFYSQRAGAIRSKARFNANGNLRYAQGNIDSAPGFVNAGAGDVRLSTGAAGVNAGRTTGAAGVDIVNVRRPQGPQVDIGAYER